MDGMMLVGEMACLLSENFEFSHFDFVSCDFFILVQAFYDCNGY